MSALTNLIREQAQRLELPDVKTQRDRWIQAEQDLIRQLETWLKEADPDGFLKVVRSNHPLREEKYGSYDAVWRLKIDLGARCVEIVPRGGAVGGAVRPEGGNPLPIRGLVDMTNEIDRFRLCRLIDGDGERWVITPELSHHAKLLDQRTFEEAMFQLLS